jgi:hypothetical protein
VQIELRTSLRDDDERLVVRARIPGWSDALVELSELARRAEELSPDGWRMLQLRLISRPERGKACDFDCQWVSPEWWRKRRANSPRDRRNEFNARRKQARREGER